MKKSLVIGLIVLFVCIAFAPCINANVNFNKNILNNDNENLNCFIIARASNTGMIISGPRQTDLVLRPYAPISTYQNITLSYSYKRAAPGDPWEDYPSIGWVWTKGSNGVKSWSGDSLWGNLGNERFKIWLVGVYLFDYCLVYKGATGFTGIRIGGLFSCIYIGTASHVNIVTEFPG
jgi:hypothetical protein